MPLPDTVLKLYAASHYRLHGPVDITHGRAPARCPRCRELCVPAVFTFENPMRPPERRCRQCLQLLGNGERG
jgi:hypothetical protein